MQTSEGICTGVDGADAEQGSVSDGSQVVSGQGGHGPRVEIPVVQHRRRQLRRIAPVALVAVQPPVVVATPRPLQHSPNTAQQLCTINLAEKFPLHMFLRLSEISTTGSHMAGQKQSAVCGRRPFCVSWKTSQQSTGLIEMSPCEGRHAGM